MMLQPLKTALIVGFKLLLCLSVSLSCAEVYAQMPSSQAILEQLAVNQQDLKRLDQGDIVLFNVESSGEMELTSGVVIYLPTTPAQVSGLFKKDSLASIDPLVISAGFIPLQANQEAFKRFSVKAGSDEEAEFLEATPGSQFNLSTQEFDLIRTQESNQPDRASKLYRQILWQRWQSYRKNGIKGIAPYDRGNNTLVNPGVDLQTAGLEHDLLKPYFPELFNAWLNYPDMPLPKGVEDFYNWSNRLVQSRATAILTHRLMLSEAQGELILIRQFYAGHSFNANQLTIICLPYKQGSLVFYTNRTFTDQVSGFGSALKHLIGDNMAQSQVTNLLKIMQKHFKKINGNGG